MVERFNGRIQREVLGITVASHRDLETLLHGFNRAYNARRQRVLKGRSPERVVHDRLGAVPPRANSSHDPPFDPCALPKALQVIARAKDVSHPDTLPMMQCRFRFCSMKKAYSSGVMPLSIRYRSMSESTRRP